MVTTKKRVRVEVTWEDIEKGMPIDPRDCPVARAVRRLFPYKKVSVHPGGDDWFVEVYTNAGVPDVGDSMYRVPAPAGRRIDAYDDGKGMAPFAFTMTEVEGQE